MRSVENRHLATWVAGLLGVAVTFPGPITDVLADASLMSAHRLELPYGFTVMARR